MINFREIVLITACLSAISVGVPIATAQAQGTSGPANVLSVEVPGQSQASVGDLIGLPVTYPVVPTGMLSDLRVTVRGEGVRFVTVASTPRTVDDRPVVGVGVLTAFVVADKPGDVVITVTPVKLDGKDGEAREYRIKVATRKAPGN